MFFQLVKPTAFRGEVAIGMPLSINDPGNCDLAITVKSTHRDMPPTYGVSYFSTKGPSSDGRIKLDLVAPGEKIISRATGSKNKPSSPTSTSKTAVQAWPRPTCRGYGCFLVGSPRVYWQTGKSEGYFYFHSY